MGLDMYLFRVRKASLTPHSMLGLEERDAFESKGYSFYPADQAPLHCKTLADNLVPVTSMVRCYDKFILADKMCEQHGLEYDVDMEDNIYFSAYGPDGGRLSYHAPDGNSYSLDMTEDEINQCIINKKVDEYIVKMEEVAYQRKGLSDRGWELMACENCDYTDDFDAVKAMVDEGGLSEEFTDNWVNGETVFHPWW